MNSLHRLGMTSAWGMTAAYLCSAHALTGQLQEARESACKARPVLSSLGLEGLLLVHIALLCGRSGRSAEAARLLGCSQAWYAANHNSPDSTMLRLFGIIEADVEAALGSAELEHQRAAGAAMSAGETAALVRSLIGAANDPSLQPAK